MNGIEASDVLRIAVISGLIGFGVFCASFAATVWYRRNKTRPNRLARYSFLLMVLGIFGAAGNWAYNEFSSRSGIVGGQDLFVVHAKRNVTIDKLALEGAVQKGDRLVEFLPPSIDGQLAVIDSHIKQSMAKLDYFNLRALPIDTSLLQRAAQLRQQIDQAKSMTLDIQKSYREAQRAQLDARTQYAEKQSQNDLQVAAEKQNMNTAMSQIEISQSAMTRADSLRKAGVGTQVSLEEKTSNHLIQTLAGNRAQANIVSLTKYRAAIDESYGRTLRSLDAQLASLTADAENNRVVMAALTDELKRTEAAVQVDRERAVSATTRERDAVMHELEGLRAERAQTLAVTQVKAPFEGEVVYRHPAPGFAPENTPILAMAAGTGFVARIWLPTDDIEAVKQAGKVQLALEQPILNRYFGGQFRSFEKAPYEKNRVLAIFDVKLPLEAITLLAQAGSPIQVKLLWRPALMTSPAFQGSLILCGVGGIGIVFAGMRRRPANDDLAVPQIEADLVASRLHELARDFHVLIRQGRLSEDLDLVRGVLRITSSMGDPALAVLRREIVFDEQLEQAITQWSRFHFDPELMRLLNQVRHHSLAHTAA